MNASAASLPYDYMSGIVTATTNVEQAILRLHYSIPQTSNATTQLSGKFSAHFAKLQVLEVDQTLWLEGSAPPNDFALAWARLFLQQIQSDDFLPTGILASAEGGVGIYFVDGDKYADIECFNSGAILGVISNRRDRPVAWEVEQDESGLACASLRIRKFLDATETKENVLERPGYRQPFRAIRALISSLHSRGHRRLQV
jgi:hypothetical protein